MVAVGAMRKPASRQRMKELFEKCLNGRKPSGVRCVRLVEGKPLRVRWCVALQGAGKNNVESDGGLRYQRRCAYFKLYGLRSDGKIGRKTPVMFKKLARGRSYCDHPVFRGIPFADLRSVPRVEWMRFTKVMKRIQCRLEKVRVGQSHLNANRGVQLGNSIVSGGRYRNSIHCGKCMKRQPLERRLLWTSLQKMCEAVYGREAWYIRQCVLAARLNDACGEIRTLPGLPFSGIWYTFDTHDKGFHRDGNTVGCSILLSMYKVAGGHICMQLPNGNWIEHLLQPKYMIAGRWSEFLHCNDHVVGRTKERRRSMILYLDRACFSASYTYVVPFGYKEE